MKASSRAGPERFVLALALLVPLVLGGLALAQLPGASLGSPTNLLLGDDAGPNVVRQRPAPSNAGPPPTLVPPTATVRPTATTVPSATVVPTAEPTIEATAAPRQGRTYVVHKGDQLKDIAAQYQVNIWKIINNNDIPNPDSLRVGQVLTIPDD